MAVLRAAQHVGVFTGEAAVHLVALVLVTRVPVSRDTVAVHRDRDQDRDQDTI